LNSFIFNGLNKIGVANGFATRWPVEVLKHTDYDYENNEPNQEVLGDIVQGEVLI
jgi:hypothetical protein